MCIHLKNLPHVKRTRNSVCFISLEQNVCSDSGRSRSECDLRQLPSAAANHSHRRWRWWVKHSYMFLLPNGHGILLKVWPFVLSIGTVRVWHSNTYRLENTLNYGMERVWCICGQPGSNSVAIGFDEGSIIIKVVIFVVFSQIFWMDFLSSGVVKIQLMM